MNKDMHKYFRQLRREGWIVEFNGHAKLRSPWGQLFTCSVSPRCPHALKNLKADIKKYRKPDAGFSLIEVVFAAAIGLIVIFGIMSVLAQVSRQTGGIRAELAFIQFGIWPTLFPAYPAACTAAIGGQPFAVGGTNPIAYLDPSGAILTVGSVYQQMTFTKVAITDLGTTGVPNQYNAQLIFQAKKMPFIGGAPYMNLKTTARVAILGGLINVCF